jgi:hypothetical protein
VTDSTARIAAVREHGPVVSMAKVHSIR